MNQLTQADRGASNLQCTCPSGDGSLRWPCPQHAPKTETTLRDVMIDIETLGLAPGSVILTIGAVMFGQDGLGETFYAPVLTQSCLDVGLTIDPETEAWWSKQSQEARAAAFRPDAAPLEDVLRDFSAWLQERGAERPWCQGADFDVPLLNAAYKACSLAPPWKFWNLRDTRTLYELAGVKPDRTKGVYHNALDDARNQAEAAVKALNILKGPAYVTSEVTGEDLKVALEEVFEDRAGWRTKIAVAVRALDYDALSSTECVQAAPEDVRNQALEGPPVRVLGPSNDVVSAGAYDVLAERRRQVDKEGWTPEHDDAHNDGQMAGAAACYAVEGITHWARTGIVEMLWPWSADWWKPADNRRNLIKAGALILAEIERMDRMTTQGAATTA